MAGGVYSLIPAQRLQEVLENLHQFTGISIQLIDHDGTLLLSFGEPTGYCSILKKNVLSKNECFELHMKAGQRAHKIGQAYIFSCHADLNHIAFPLINRDELLGSIIIGPFLMDKPDSTLICDVAEKYGLSPALALELYDELSNVPTISPDRAGQLQKLADHLLSPLIPSERVTLLQNREKAYQQAKINETIQAYKEQQLQPSLIFFHKKEKELFAKVRTGSIQEVKGLLNELIGYVLFSEGGRLEAMRIRAIELTTLLSRVAMDGGANADSVYQLNGNFLTLINQKQNLDELCMLLQEVAEGFTNAMFYEKDKGNTYIRKALRFIADNYFEHLELAAVADFVQLSPSYFSTLFHQVVGMNFREYLCSVRVEESKRLLLSTEFSLADIAVSVGFPDQSYYCKVFKRVVGISPGKFRARPGTTEEESE